MLIFIKNFWIRSYIPDSELSVERCDSEQDRPKLDGRTHGIACPTRSGGRYRTVKNTQLYDLKMSKEPIHAWRVQKSSWSWWHWNGEWQSDENEVKQTREGFSKLRKQTEWSQVQPCWLFCLLLSTCLCMALRW